MEFRETGLVMVLGALIASQETSMVLAQDSTEDDGGADPTPPPGEFFKGWMPKFYLYNVHKQTTTMRPRTSPFQSLKLQPRAVAARNPLHHLLARTKTKNLLHLQVRPARTRTTTIQAAPAPQTTILLTIPLPQTLLLLKATRMPQCL